MFRSARKQQGSVLIVAVFVIVVMGMMAAMLNRMQWSNQDSHVREVNGTHAWLAAQSASECMLVNEYPLSVSGAQPTCSLSDLKVFYQDNHNCVIDSERSRDWALGEDSYFQISSRAVCGSKLHQVERQHEVWGKE
ncbi:MSHA biogenesis protein MshP [Vibrio astriarenae]|uniref:MSHA biogenesis protein MshP n=1 Tax=Vibrio astriarenae TaxID=1481923 RepID=A0A7Z2T4S5_9VIBR|nr:MSHA biogenesis protein MshP [Vibrio astriarenae]QIA64302.1 MSHA biogenesis protein MshP [Vibrio astriarenae]